MVIPEAEMEDKVLVTLLLEEDEELETEDAEEEVGAAERVSTEILTKLKRAAVEAEIVNDAASSWTFANTPSSEKWAEVVLEVVKVKPVVLAEVLTVTEAVFVESEL